MGPEVFLAADRMGFRMCQEPLPHTYVNEEKGEKSILLCTDNVACHPILIL